MLNYIIKILKKKHFLANVTKSIYNCNIYVIFSRYIRNKVEKRRKNVGASIARLFREN